MQREKRMRKIEQYPRNVGVNHVMGIPEGEEGKEEKKYLK
jgi:hypothetical protein